MLETPHVAVGIAIATKVGNPMLAIPIAFASHFVLDKIPHWNPHFYTETQKNGKPSKGSTTLAVIDSLFALGIGLFMAGRALPDNMLAFNILACSLASVASDQVKIPFYFFGKRDGLMKRWTDFERSIQVDAPFVPGMLTQVAIIIASFWWILN